MINPHSHILIGEQIDELKSKLAQAKSEITAIKASNKELVEALGSVVKIYNKAPDSHTNIASDAMMRTAQQALAKAKELG